MRIGFIGLGNIGKPMASHFAPAGHDTTVHDLLEDAVTELVSGGAQAATCPREVAERADVIGVCVPEDDHVRAVLEGDDGVLSGARQGTTVLVHSTVQPDTVVRLNATAAERGARVLDACVTGGDTGAASKNLTYMVGADEADVRELAPYFAASSNRDVVYCGAIGNGCRLKLAVNTMTYLQWAAAYESAELARASGLPVELLEQVTSSNGQLTPMMQQYLAIVKAPAEQIRSSERQAYLRRSMDIAEKDLAWALSLARKSGLAMPAAAVVSQSMARLYRVDDEGRR